MWPLSPYARPVSSFQRPVPLVFVEPSDAPRVCVEFNAQWLPYVIGALKQLTLQTSWDSIDPEIIQTQQERSMDLINIFAAAEICTNALLLSDELEYEMSVCEQLRFQDGKLQGLCCGVWSDISGQPPQGWQTGPTGIGQTPPSAGGGCVSYKAGLSGNGYWYAPFVVNTGDTLTISNSKGATYNPANGLWYCTDGSTFFAGACLASTATNAGNPMPAVLTGKLIAKIGGTFYDVNNGGTFVVPAGIASQPVTFQFNYASV